MWKLALLSLSLSGLISCNSALFSARETSQGSQPVRELPVVEAVTDSFQQIERQRTPFSSVFGVPGQPAQQELLQPDLLLDMVIVIDNSESMAEEQENLSDKLEVLLSELGDVNWQIRIVTTDRYQSNSCYRDLIRFDEADAAARFKTAVTAGITGSGHEHGIRNATLALDGSCNELTQPNTWLRQGSAIAVMFVTDEDNCSAGTCLLEPNYNQLDPFDYVDGLKSAVTMTHGRVLGETARFYGLIRRSAGECSQAANVGTTYVNLINDSQGKSGPICDNDYTATLSNISQDIAQLLTPNLRLSQSPDPDSLEVWIGDEQVTDFTLTSEAEIQLDPPPPPGSTVTATYTYGSEQPADQGFVLNPTPASLEAAEFEITIDGEAAPEESFSWEPSSSQLVIEQDLDLGSDIQVTYFPADQALLSSFKLSRQPAQEANWQVSVDGEELSKDQFSYDPETGELQLADTPEEGAEISVSYDTQISE